MLNDPSLRIKAHQIVVFVIPTERIGAQHIPGSVSAEPPLLPDRVLKIMEADLAILRNTPVKLVHIIVDGLIHGLDPVLYIKLAPQQLRIIDTGQAFDLLDQRQGLLVRNEFGRLHAVHQQFQFRQLKFMAGHIVPTVFPTAGLKNVKPILPQRLQIIIDALALCRNPVAFQLPNQLGHRHRVILIRPL